MVAKTGFGDSRGGEIFARLWIFGVEYSMIVCGEADQRLRRRVFELPSSATGSKVEAVTDLSWLLFQSGIHVAFSFICF